jgi:hypothetical protein
MLSRDNEQVGGLMITGSFGCCVPITVYGYKYFTILGSSVKSARSSSLYNLGYRYLSVKLNGSVWIKFIAS